MRLLALALRGALAWPAARFEAALRDPEAAQARLRARLIDRARATAYGRGFRRWEDVPVVDWEDIAPWVARQRAEEGPVLVPDRVVRYETTSGSTGAAKPIPYTRPLLRSFTRMLAVWAHDLLARGPAFRTGRLYFSVSPDLDGPRATARGVPEGAVDDRDYLAGPSGWLLRPFWRSPPGVAAIRDPETFRRTVATFLAHEERLEVISVWSPSFLRVLLDWMVAHRAELPRAEAVGDWPRYWPELKLVSCWDRAGAAGPAEALRRAFPGVRVQGKGLLATEAPLTVPLIGRGDAPLVDEVVIELEDERGVRPLVDAEPGGVYRLVVSQAAGLLRYRLGDEVRVDGRVEATPSFHLVGRGEVVDLVGEKLHERFVADALAGVGMPAGFVALVGAGDRYRLVVERLDRPGPALAGAVDAALCAAHHYRLARRLGQLGPVEVVVDPDAARADLEAGRWGGTKHRLLRPGGGSPGGG